MKKCIIYLSIIFVYIGCKEQPKKADCNIEVDILNFQNYPNFRIQQINVKQGITICADTVKNNQAAIELVLLNDSVFNVQTFSVANTISRANLGEFKMAKINSTEALARFILLISKKANFIAPEINTDIIEIK